MTKHFDQVLLLLAALLVSTIHCADAKALEFYPCIDANGDRFIIVRHDLGVQSVVPSNKLSVTLNGATFSLPAVQVYAAFAALQLTGGPCASQLQSIFSCASGVENYVAFKFCGHTTGTFAIEIVGTGSSDGIDLAEQCTSLYPLTGTITFTTAPACTVPSPAPAPAPTAPASSCFSADGKVLVKNVGSVPMHDLKVGDKILTSTSASKGARFEAVYAFGHRETHTESKFLQIFLSSPDHPTPLEITNDHLLYRGSKNVHALNAVPADEIAEGDLLMTATGMLYAVSEVKHTNKVGIYMPLTPSGQLMVDGIQVSAYVSMEKQFPGVSQLATQTLGSQDALFHWWLAPLRVMCIGVTPKFCEVNHEGILPYLIVGQKVAKFVENRATVVRQFIFQPLIILVFGVIVGVEATLGPSLGAVFLFFILTSFFFGWKRILSVLQLNKYSTFCSTKAE